MGKIFDESWELDDLREANIIESYEDDDEDDDDAYDEEYGDKATRRWYTEEDLFSADERAYRRDLLYKLQWYNKNGEVIKLHKIDDRYFNNIINFAKKHDIIFDIDGDVEYITKRRAKKIAKKQEKKAIKEIITKHKKGELK